MQCVLFGLNTPDYIGYTICDEVARVDRYVDMNT